MNEKEIQCLLREIRELMQPYLERSGAVFYSGSKTLSKGNFYLMGLNPGGDPKKEGSIRSSLDEWERSKHDWCAYVNDNWTKKPDNEGNDQHQKNVQYLCEEVLNENSANVFSANAIFLRSLNGNKLDMSVEFLSQCWKVHLHCLREVKPRVLICLGNGPGSSFKHVHRWLGGNLDIEKQSEPCGFRGKSQAFVRWFDSSTAEELFALNKPLRVIGLPHPSRYWYKNLRDFKQKVNVLIG